MKQWLAGWLWLRDHPLVLLMRDESDDTTNPAVTVNGFAAKQKAFVSVRS
jgi:hypothetical protein